SSRRRHTRWPRDWSSDVCSSDLGGEPLAHKDLAGMVRYAAERGIHPMICTNGSLWTEQNMRSLANDGLSSVIMSIDAHDVTRHEIGRASCRERGEMAGGEV